MANIFDGARDTAARTATGIVCPIFKSTPIQVASYLSGKINTTSQVLTDALNQICDGSNPAPDRPASGTCGVAGQTYKVRQFATKASTGRVEIGGGIYGGPLSIVKAAIVQGQQRWNVGTQGVASGSFREGESVDGSYDDWDIVDPVTLEPITECQASIAGPGYPPLTPAQQTNLNLFIDINNTYNFIGGDNDPDPEGEGGGGSDCPDVNLAPVLAAVATLAGAQALAFAAQTAALSAFSTATAATLANITLTLGLIRTEVGFINGNVNTILDRLSNISAQLTRIENDVDDIEALATLTLDGVGFDGISEYLGRDGFGLVSAREMLQDIIERIGYDESDSKLTLLNEEQGAASVESVLAILYTHEGIELGLQERLGDGTFDEPYITVAEALQDIRETPVQPVIVQGWEIQAPRKTSARLHYASKPLSKNQEVRIEIPNFDKTITVDSLPGLLKEFVRGDTFHILEYEDGSNIQVWTTNDGAGTEFVAALSQLSLNEYNAERIKKRLGGKNKPLVKQGATFYLHTLEILEPQDEGFKRTVLRVRRET